MIFVDDNKDINDPRINLALEEYLLRNLKTEDDILLFYINSPSIIIGRNQNTLEEINHEYVDANGVHVVRRLSGGGAVYHDLGNLNFSFITNYHSTNFRNFKKFTEPVIQVLKEMGVEAELSGRNDILVNGFKVSGNAQYSTTSRMYSHGTLLFNSHLENVAKALNVKMSKISSKGIKSVRSRVANLSEFIQEPMDVFEFRERIMTGVFRDLPGIPRYHLTDKDWEGVQKLTEERYGNWDWNYGKSPEFNVQKTNRFPTGEVDARINVLNGIIQSIKFYGDFLGQGEVGEIEEKLKGIKFDRESLAEAINHIEIETYFGGLAREEFLNFLY